MDSSNSLFRLRGNASSIQALRNTSMRAAPHAQDAAVVYDGYRPLDHGCSLFGRKFDAASAGPVLRLALDCDHGLGFDPSCVLDPPPVEPLQQRVAQYQRVR